MQPHGNIGLKAKAEIYIYDRWHECGVHYSILVLFLFGTPHIEGLECVSVCMCVQACVQLSSRATGYLGWNLGVKQFLDTSTFIPLCFVGMLGIHCR